MVDNYNTKRINAKDVWLDSVSFSRINPFKVIDCLFKWDIHRRFEILLSFIPSHLYYLPQSHVAYRNGFFSPGQGIYGEATDYFDGESKIDKRKDMNLRIMQKYDQMKVRYSLTTLTLLVLGTTLFSIGFCSLFGRLAVFVVALFFDFQRQFKQCVSPNFLRMKNRRQFS